jgi:Flp pilus assembly protein TadD
VRSDRSLDGGGTAIKGLFSFLRAHIPSHWFLAAAAVAISVAAYLQSASFDFAYDDFGQIVFNPRIQSWKFLWSNLTSHVWAHTGDIALYYRPVFMMWLTANYSLFGLNPLFWHVAAVGLYAVSCILVFLFASRLTEDKWVAAVAVLLFGLHPGHVESVAWVSGATDPLMGIFLMGSLLFYMKHRDSGIPGMTAALSASLLLALLAVFTKETALIIPGIIFGYEWIFHRGGSYWKERFRPAMRAALIYVPIVIAYLVIRALALKSTTPPHTTIGFRSVLLAWPQVIAFYISHMLWPWRLSVFYHPLMVFHPGFRNFVLPLMAAAAGAAALYYGSRRSRVFAFLSWWCVIMLVPMLNVTLWGNLENVHDRYLYLPSVAFALMIARALSRLRALHRSKWVAAVLILIGGGYIYMIENEIQYWSSDFELAQRGVEVSPGHPIATQLLGNAYIRQGRIAEAIPWLMESAEANPLAVQTFCNLAYCYNEMNTLGLAGETIAKAISLKATEPRAHLVLGMIRRKQNRLEEAEAEIQLGIQLQHQLTPGREELFHYHLGDVLYAKGDREGAIREYQLELRNDPNADPAVASALERIHQLEQPQNTTVISR